MAGRPRIGVTGNARRWAPSWWCIRLALFLVGGRAERISVRHAASGLRPDALVISGGDDIGPELYGGSIDPKVKLDPERDQLEIQWTKRGIDAGIPILGICRGAQLINMVLGGDLHPDIRDMRKRTYNRPGLLPTKQVELLSGSRMASVCGHERIRVNSLHHQAIRKPGNGLRVVGNDLDQIVQAIESTSDLRLIGVQWHPEYLLYLPSQLRIFRWLVTKIEE